MSWSGPGKRLGDRHSCRSIRDGQKCPSPSPPGEPASYLIVAGLVLLACALLYGPRWLSGQTVFRGAIQEQYYLLGQYAFDRLITDSFAGAYGEPLFPLWNHLNALGTPLLGNMLSGVFYPLKPFLYLFPTDPARDVYIIARLLIAALLAFALARRMGIGRAGATLAALAFALSGYMKMFVNENYLNADVLLPGLVLFTLRLRDRRRLSDFLIVAGLVFAVANNGHPEAAFYTLLLPAFLAVAAGPRPGVKGAGPRARDAAGTALLFGAAAALALLASQAMLLPFAEYWGRGYHFHLPSAGFFHYSARQAASLLTPWCFGPAPAGAAFLWTPELKWAAEGAALSYVETTVPWLAPSLGVVPVLLALLAFRPRRLGRLEALLAAYALFFLGVMFGLPLFRLVGHLPILSLSGNFKHPEPGVALAAALLAGRGLERALACSRPSMRPRLAAAIVVAALAGLVVDGYQQPMRDPGYERTLAAGQAMKTLEKLQPLERVYISQDLAPPNLNILFDLADLRVMDGVNDRRLVNAINAINGHDRAQAGDYWYREVGYLQPAPDTLGHPLLDLFNVGYALTDGPLPYNRTIKQWLAQGAILAPGPGYVGPARLDFDGVAAPSLLTHPPSRLDWYLPAPAGVRFRPAATADAVARQPDGAWLALMANGRLAYVRHLHPKLQPADTRVPIVELRLEVDGADTAELSFQALPAQTTDFDQVGWADLRAAQSGEGDLMAVPGWVEVVKDSPRLYQNRKVRPRAFVVFSAKMTSKEEALALLAKGEIDPARTALITGTDLPAEGKLEPKDAPPPPEVLAFEHGPQRVTARTRTDRTAWLVVGDLYYPGWRGRVDGVEKRIYRADYLLRGVPLEPGDHEVTMTNEPASFHLGLFLMVVGLLAGPAAMMVFGRRRSSEGVSSNLPPS